MNQSLELGSSFLVIQVAFLERYHACVNISYKIGISTNIPISAAAGLPGA